MVGMNEGGRVLRGRSRWLMPGALRSSALSALSASSALTASSLSAQSPPSPISDNSFLIEEAYNQDPRVVQHISNFSRSSDGSWLYTFTQEWPVTGIRHQLSYTIPVLHNDGTGVGDFQLNYRLQVLGDDNAAVAFAPRLTLLLPTGSSSRARGAGGAGVQIGLPVSLRPSTWLALHFNAGLTLFPTEKNTAGAEATGLNYNLGASAVWLAFHRLNFLTEWEWFDTETPVSGGGARRDQAMFLNPGMRWSYDFRSGLQIVPGVAYTIGLGPSDGADALFLYLSFEHPF
jgi:hypothetical protein